VIRCPQCANDNLPNTLFCDTCGADIRPGAAVAAPPPVSVPLSGAGSRQKLYLYVHGSGGKWVRLPSQSLLVIGRTDTTTGTKPEIDLSPYNAADTGVSRRHAQLRRTEHGLTLEDLGSMNGTFVNNQRLAPNRPVSLPQGALVRLGKLQLRFELRDE
jgi:hypothetical protein